MKSIKHPGKSNQTINISYTLTSTLEILEDIRITKNILIIIRNNLIDVKPYDFDPQRKFSVTQKRQMLILQHYRCNTVDQVNCFKIITVLSSEADHINPYYKKGLTVIRNGQMLCKPCHRYKTKNDLLPV